ncbi:hypothetical protein CASFOL_017811 [Castilleja foliolosa]|uniref:Uncharacterized protein n=1 Tax=Castilleja foliolosa TaxID=1961234 RepID=A0ABD3DC30_9LAMI
MVGKSSSSKRKSSKRKRDKTSSQKKSRGKESKKRNRIHDSVPSYTDDESSNSEHTSKSHHKRRITIHKNKRPRRDYTTSSSSEDRSLSSDSDSDYSSHKKVRSSRTNLKKRASKRSKRPKDSGDDEHSGKKRKRSSRDSVIKPKKKKTLKKKIKKCLSSDSESCSISRSISSSDTADCKHRRSKFILNDERERSRGRESYKSRKTRRMRSPSRSSCDRVSKLSVSDGALSPVNDINININIPRRLKSVIAVVNQQYDEEENKLDPHKEEIVYDQNDYPSTKSPDSNEEETKMELYEPDLNSNINDCDRLFEEVDMNDFEKGNKEIETSVHVAALEGDALESILRQKALDNLKKFKGRVNNLKTNNKSVVNRSPSDVIIENVQNESTEPNFQELDHNSVPSLKSDLSEITEVEKLSDSENVEKELERATRAVEQSSEVVSKTDTCPGGEITNVGSDFISESSTGLTMTGEQILDGGNEAKDSSQFEQKTMTVMRGGEMVQVSYKVYIPKKAPALARRPLKR